MKKRTCYYITIKNQLASFDMGLNGADVRFAFKSLSAARAKSLTCGGLLNSHITELHGSFTDERFQYCLRDEILITLASEI
jgi:hypothetical protein